MEYWNGVESSGMELEWQKFLIFAHKMESSDVCVWPSYM